MMPLIRSHRGPTRCTAFRYLESRNLEAIPMSVSVGMKYASTYHMNLKTSKQHNKFRLIPSQSRSYSSAVAELTHENPAKEDSFESRANSKALQEGSSLNEAKKRNGPIAAYNNLVASKKLRADPHQFKTMQLLESLFLDLESYQPPDLPRPHVVKNTIMKQVGGDAGRDKIQSPDFAWIENKEETIIKKIFKLFEPAQQSSKAIYGPKGLYLYGDVGTGKTMVMDMFYESISTHKKRRVHFHAFMQDTHKRIHNLRTHEGITSDPLPIIASELAHDAFVLCFDELQVTDITDAMILRRLFDELFKRGVVMVSTSNRPPDDLYQNGIQRASFIPAIELLKERCAVHSLNSGIDYRKRDDKRYHVYYSPLDNETNDRVRHLFNALCKDRKVEPVDLEFWGRKLHIQETSGEVAKIPFKYLCGEAHSAADYLELSKNFKVIILTDIPAMTLAHRNEARRFITLIDAMYDNKVKLIASMEANLAELFLGEPHKASPGTINSAERMLMDDLKLSTAQLTSAIFTGAEEVFAFQRALSRLIEMQTKEWLGDEIVQTLVRLDRKSTL